MTIDEHALAKHLFDDIAAMSTDIAGVSRPAFSDVETRVLDYLESFARAEGLHVEPTQARTGCSACPVTRMPSISFWSAAMSIPCLGAAITTGWQV